MNCDSKFMLNKSQKISLISLHGLDYLFYITLSVIKLQRIPFKIELRELKT